MELPLRSIIFMLGLLSGSAVAATGTIYYPSAYPLDASKVQGAGQGVKSLCSANTTTTLDLDLADDYIITGLEEIVIGASIGDYIDLSIVLTSNKNVVIATPIPGPWYVSANADNDFRFEMPMKIQGGWTLRITYHATAILVTPTIAVNYKLWKIQ